MAKKLKLTQLILYLSTSVTSTNGYSSFLALYLEQALNQKNRPHEQIFEMERERMNKI